MQARRHPPRLPAWRSLDIDTKEAQEQGSKKMRRSKQASALPKPKALCLTGRVLLEGLLDGDEVLEALGHLEALDVEVTGVQEVVHPLTAVVLGLRLRRRNTRTNESRTQRNVPTRCHPRLPAAHRKQVSKNDPQSENRMPDIPSTHRNHKQSRLLSPSYVPQGTCSAGAPHLRGS